MPEEKVTLEGVGDFIFPEGTTPDQITDYFNSSQFAPIAISQQTQPGSPERRQAIRDVQPLIRAETAQTIEPSWLDVPANLASTAGRAVASGFLDPVLITGEVGGDIESAIARRTGLPIDTGPLGYAGRAARYLTSEEMFPMAPRREQGPVERLAEGVAAGVGSAAGMGLIGLLTGGLGLAPRAARTVQAVAGGVSEGRAAMDEELQRQEEAGEARDVTKARLKGLAYGAASVPLEFLGVPRTLEKSLTRSTKRGILPALKTGAAETAIGMVQEGTQAGLQDLIVHGRVNPENVLMSMAVGGIVQGGIGSLGEQISQRDARDLASQISRGRETSEAARTARREYDGLLQAVAMQKGKVATAEQAEQIANYARAINADRANADALAREIGAARDEGMQRRVIEQLKLGEQLGPTESARLAELMAEGRIISESNDIARQLAAGKRVDDIRERARRIHENNILIETLLAVPKRPAAFSTEGIPELQAGMLLDDVNSLMLGQRILGSYHRLAQMTPMQRAAVEMLARNWTPLNVAPESAPLLRNIRERLGPYEGGGDLTASDLWTMAGRRADATAEWFQEAQGTPAPALKPSQRGRALREMVWEEPAAPAKKKRKIPQPSQVDLSAPGQPPYDTQTQVGVRSPVPQGQTPGGPVPIPQEGRPQAQAGRVLQTPAQVRQAAPARTKANAGRIRQIISGLARRFGQRVRFVTPAELDAELGDVQLSAKSKAQRLKLDKNNTAMRFIAENEKAIDWNKVRSNEDLSNLAADQVRLGREALLNPTTINDVDWDRHVQAVRHAASQGDEYAQRILENIERNPQTMQNEFVDEIDARWQPLVGKWLTATRREPDPFAAASITNQLKGFKRDKGLPPMVPHLVERLVKDMQSRPQFNILDQYNIYFEEYLKRYDQVDVPGTDLTWYKIPGHASLAVGDTANKEINESVLQAMSCRGWCTSSYAAPTYLNRGDFWLLRDKKKHDTIASVTMDGDGTVLDAFDIQNRGAQVIPRERWKYVEQLALQRPELNQELLWNHPAASPEIAAKAIENIQTQSPNEAINGARTTRNAAMLKAYADRAIANNQYPSGRMLANRVFLNPATRAEDLLRLIPVFDNDIILRSLQLMVVDNERVTSPEELQPVVTAVVDRLVTGNVIAPENRDAAIELFTILRGNSGRDRRHSTVKLSPQLIKLLRTDWVTTTFPQHYDFNSEVRKTLQQALAGADDIAEARQLWSAYKTLTGNTASVDDNTRYLLEVLFRPGRTLSDENAVELWKDFAKDNRRHAIGIIADLMEINTPEGNSFIEKFIPAGLLTPSEWDDAIGAHAILSDQSFLPALARSNAPLGKIQLRNISGYMWKLLAERRGISWVTYKAILKLQTHNNYSHRREALQEIAPLYTKSEDAKTFINDWKAEVRSRAESFKHIPQDFLNYLPPDVRVEPWVAEEFIEQLLGDHPYYSIFPRFNDLSMEQADTFRKNLQSALYSQWNALPKERQDDLSKALSEGGYQHPKDAIDARWTERIKALLAGAPPHVIQLSRAPAGTEGYYDRYTNQHTYVPDNIESEERATEVFLHEMTHGNLANLALTPEAAAELDAIFAAARQSLIAGTAAQLKRTGYTSVEDLARQYGFDLTTPEGRRRLMGELTSRFAETVDPDNPPNWFSRMLNQLKLWLAKHFGINLSERDIAVWLQSQWRTLEKQARAAEEAAQPEPTSQEIAELLDYSQPPAPPAAATGPRNAQGQLLAPNGKVSKLSEGQWRQVRTPAFKAWFGDWENDPANASKVVDEETGEPKVVYHGTTKEFKEFGAKGKKGKVITTSHTLDTALGSHFAADPSVADAFSIGSYVQEGVHPNFVISGKHPGEQGVARYTDPETLQLREAPIVKVGGPRSMPKGMAGFPLDFEDENIVMMKPGGRTIPAFLNVRKPLDVRQSQMLQGTSDSINVNHAVLKIAFASNPDLREAYRKSKQPGASHYTSDQLADIASYTLPPDLIDQAVETFKTSAGYDGIIYTNTSRLEVRQSIDVDPTSYIVPESNQIKSAVGNRGTFSPATADIEFSRPGFASAERLQQAVTRPGLTPEGQAQLERQAGIQTTMIPRRFESEMERWHIDPDNRQEQRAARMSKRIRELAQTTRTGADLRTAPPEEQSAGSRVTFYVHGVLEDVKSRLKAAFNANVPKYLNAINAIPKATKANTAANYHMQAADDLERGYGKYVREQLLAAKGDPTAEGQIKAILDKAATSADRTLLHRPTVNMILQQLADNPAIPAGPKVKAADVLAAAKAAGFTGTLDPDTVNYLLNGGPGRLAPGLLRIPGIGRMIMTLRDLRSAKSTAAADALAWAGSFNPTKPGKKTVSLKEYSEMLEKHVRANERAAALAQELNKDLADKTDQDGALKLVLDMIEQIQNSPEYRDQLAFAAQHLDVDIQGAMWHDVGNARDVYQSPTDANKQYFVSTVPGPKVEEENRKQLQAAKADITDYLTNAAYNPNPIERYVYTRMLERIQGELDDTSLSTEQSHLRGYRARATLHKATSFGLPWLRTAYNLMLEIGGRTAKRLMSRSTALNYSADMIRNIAQHSKYGDAAIDVATAKAMVAHGLDPSNPKDVTTYRDTIANPLFASQQEAGDRQLKVGSETLTHQKILQQDWDMMELQYQQEQALRKAFEGELERYNSQTRIQDRIGKDLNIRRKASAQGPMVMGRRFSEMIGDFNLMTFVRWWQNQSEADKRAWINDEKNFVNTVLAYVTERSPEFNRSLEDEKLGKAFDRIANNVADGRYPTGIQDWDDLFDAVANELAVPNTPKFQDELRTTLTNALFKKINSFTKEVSENESTKHIDLAAMKGADEFKFGTDHVLNMLVQSLKTDGSFTTARGQMMMPRTWYNYARVTPQHRAALRANAVNVVRVGFIQALRQTHAALDNLVKEEYDPRLRREGERKGKRAIRKAYKKGELRFDYSAAKELLHQMDQQVKWYIQEAVNRQREFDSVSEEFTRRFTKGLGLNLLANVSSPINNLVGGTLNPAILTASLTGTRNPVGAGIGTGIQTAKHLGITLARGLNRTPLLGSAMKSVMKWIPPLYKGIQRQVQYQRRIDELMKQSGLNTRYDYYNRTLANSHSGLKGMQTALQAEHIPWYLNMMRGLTNNRMYRVLEATSPRVIDQVANNVNLDNVVGSVTQHLVAHAKGIADRRTTFPTPLDPSDPNQRITPKDLEISATQMRWLREFLRNIGSLESLVFDYIKRRNAAPNPNTVDFWKDEGTRAAVAREFGYLGNIVRDTNSPTWFRLSPLHAMIGQFASWPVNQRDTFLRLLSFVNTGSDKDERWQAAARALLGLIIIAIGSMMTAEMREEFKQLVTNRTSSMPRFGNISDNPISKEGLHYALVSMGSLIPYVSYWTDRFLGGGNSRSVADLADIVPTLGFAKSLADTLFKMFTGDPVQASADFANRWVPLSQPLLNRLPVLAEQQAARNASRAARAGAPSSLELRLPASGTFRPSPIASELRQIETAAYAGDPAAVQVAFDNAVQRMVKLRGVDEGEAERRVKSALRGRSLEARLFSRQLTEGEREDFLGNLTPRQLRDVQRAQQAESLLSEGLAGAGVTQPAGPLLGSTGSGIGRIRSDFRKRSRSLRGGSLPRIPGTRRRRSRSKKKLASAPRLRRSLRGAALTGSLPRLGTVGLTASGLPDLPRSQRSLSAPLLGVY